MGDHGKDAPMTFGALTDADLRDRVDDLRAWARSRIAQCRRDEQKFGAERLAIEAAQERMTLLAVWKTLGFKGEP